MTKEVTIRIVDNGPALIDGSVTILDAAGNEFPRDTTKPLVAICRCSHSKNRPFCDGSHKAAGFSAAERAPS